MSHRCYERVVFIDYLHWIDRLALNLTTLDCSFVIIHVGTSSSQYYFSLSTLPVSCQRRWPRSTSSLFSSFFTSFLSLTSTAGSPSSLPLPMHRTSTSSRTWSGPSIRMPLPMSLFKSAMQAWLQDSFDSCHSTEMSRWVQWRRWANEEDQSTWLMSWWTMRKRDSSVDWGTHSMVCWKHGHTSTPSAKSPDWLSSFRSFDLSSPLLPISSIWVTSSRRVDRSLPSIWSSITTKAGGHRWNGWCFAWSSRTVEPFVGAMGVFECWLLI